MALSKLERRMLEIAREKIRDGLQARVCYAISAAERELRIVQRERWTIEACDRLRKYVMASIYNWATLENWIRSERPSMAHMTENPLRMRQARVDWITWMLEGE